MDQNPVSWVDAIERIGISGALLLLFVLVGRYYLAPLFQSHMTLVGKLGDAIHQQETTNVKQTQLLEKIVEEEREEKQLMKENSDGISRIERGIERIEQATKPTKPTDG